MTMTNKGTANGRLANLKVVLVDDERLTLKLLSAILKREGAEARTFTNADEILETVDLSKCDVLLSDMHMPIRDGHSLIREIRQRPPEEGGTIPAIALTAYAQHDVLARAIAEGYDLYMSKPVDPTELVAAITRLLARKKPHRKP